jgi:hypothetical protein
MTYPLVAELAAEGVPVALSCAVLGFSRQAFYAWQTQPVSQRDLERLPQLWLTSIVGRRPAGRMSHAEALSA